MERWPHPQRTEDEWKPFMANLAREIRRERRRRLVSRLSLAACLALAVWTGWSLRPPEEPARLLAEVPTTQAPIFEADAGSPGEGAPFVMVMAR